MTTRSCKHYALDVIEIACYLCTITKHLRKTCFAAIFTRHWLFWYTQLLLVAAGHTPAWINSLESTKYRSFYCFLATNTFTSPQALLAIIYIRAQLYVSWIKYWKGCHHLVHGRKNAVCSSAQRKTGSQEDAIWSFQVISKPVLVYNHLLQTESHLSIDKQLVF